MWRWSTRADVISIKAESKESALSQARSDKLAALAYLDVEAESHEIQMQFGQTDLVTIETTAKLQFLNSRDGRVLGESSDFGKSAGLDIEQALPELLKPTLASMAKEAARAACRNGLFSEPVVAQATAPSKPAPPPADTALVRDIQHALIALGYDVGTPDGIAGRQTNKAILEAERALRLPSTGKPSEMLLAKLKSHSRQMATTAQPLPEASSRIDSAPSGVQHGEAVQAIETTKLEQLKTAPSSPTSDPARRAISKVLRDRDLPEGGMGDQAPLAHLKPDPVKPDQAAADIEPGAGPAWPHTAYGGIRFIEVLGGLTALGLIVFGFLGFRRD